MLLTTVAFAAAGSSLRGAPVRKLDVWAATENSWTDPNKNSGWTAASNITSEDQCNTAWNRVATDRAGSFTCGQRIEWLMSADGGGIGRVDAMDRVSAEFPSLCGRCASCNVMLTLSAGGFTCSQRIQWLMSVGGGHLTETAARARLASEFTEECGGLTACVSSAPTTPAPSPAPTPAPTATDGGDDWDSRCGAAVSQEQTCEQGLWGPTGDVHQVQPCYRYGGNTDPCALSVTNNDGNEPYGMSKDPSLCTSRDKVFYLWDEPDTQGRAADGSRLDYAWAAEQWMQYADRWSSQIATMRSEGWTFTSPLFSFAAFSDNVQEFFDKCHARNPAADCSPNSGSPYAIDIIAANMFCGTWNSASGSQPTTDQCRAGIRWQFEDSQGQFRLMRQNTPATIDMPIYITNWARTNGCGTLTPQQQLVGMDAADEFFRRPEVHRVYWFGASNYQGCPNDPVPTGNFLNSQVRSTSPETMGDRWRSLCTRSSRH